MEGAAEIQAEIARKQKQLEEERRQNNVTIDSETNYLWPLPGYYRLTSLFGYRIHPITGKAHSHTGIDIPAPGGTPIQACKSGQVVTSAYHYSYGNYVVIDHGNGNSTLYAHMSSRAVSEGQMVSQGQTIGYVGTMVAGKLLLSTTTDVLLPSPIITLGAFLFSVALGVIFGMYPAVKASGLQPVVALRAE